MMEAGQGPVVAVEAVQPITPHNAGLAEAGKEMLTKSVEVGRDFCKAMITVSSGAIPIHIALVGLATGKEFDFDFLQGLFALAGPLLYLAAVFVFSYGYFPGRSSLSLESLDSITKARDDAINRRYNCATVGMVLFGLGVIATLGATMYFFSLPAPPPAPAAP